MDKLYDAPIGRNDPFAPLDIKETCAELNRDNSELAKNWKRVSITKWRPRKDKDMHLFRLLDYGVR